MEEEKPIEKPVVKPHKDVFTWIDKFLNTVEIIIPLSPNPRDRIAGMAAVKVVRLLNDILHAMKHKHDPEMVGKDIANRIKEDFQEAKSDSTVTSWFKQIVSKVKK